MNSQDDIPPIPIDNFKDHYVLVLDFISRQEANEKCHYTEIVREPPRLDLKCTLLPKHVSEIIVLGKRMSSVAIDKCDVVGWNIYNG